MMSQELNDSLTRVGRGTDAGEVLRRYWQPAALSVELDTKRPVVPVRLLGEDLVLFRDEQGKLGLIQRHCPHRGADMCFGRLEDNGLRCPFHGWHFDRTGQCVEQPAEPEGSRMHEKIKARAYQVVERAGIVWAYMGPGEAPAFPALDCFAAPDTHVFAFKGLWECNWLQALEVGMRTFDSSMGGMGGCPYAPGAAGNLGTEDLLYLLDSLGYHSGVELERVVTISRDLELDHGATLSSKYFRYASARF